MLKKVALSIFLCLALLGATSYGVYKFFYPGEKSSVKRQADEDEKFVAAGRTSIAIMGVDKRADDKGRSDTMFVIMYEPKTKNISMLSVPRDTRVRISEGYWDKINHSYSYGGAKRVVAALENFLGIRIDHYIELDFQGFERMVDTIGGVDINVEKRMYYEDPYDGPDGFIIDLQPGMQRLDGKKAIQYVRYRDEEGDIGRVQRQQHFINTVYGKMLNADMIKKIPDLAAAVYGAVQTDMSVTQIITLGRTLNSNSRAGIHSFSVPGTPADFNEVNYWLPDIMAVREEVSNVLGLDAREKERFMTAAARTAAAYEDSIPVYTAAAEEETKKDAEGKSADDAEKDKLDKNKKDEKNDATTDEKKNGDAKTPEKKPDSKPTPKPVSDNKAPKQVRASVINCSGEPAGGRQMESLLENSGIRVVSIFEGKEQNSSSIVSNSQDGWVVSKLAALPFRYSLSINKGDTSSVEAVIYVGKDFVNK